MSTPVAAALSVARGELEIVPFPPQRPVPAEVPSDALAADRLTPRVEALLAQQGLRPDQFRLLPLEQRDLMPGVETTVCRVTHSAPGTNLLLVTDRGTLYFLGAPDERGFREIVRSGVLPFTGVAVEGASTVMPRDGAPFRGRLLNGTRWTQESDVRLTVDSQSLATAQVPAEGPLEFELQGVSEAVRTTGNVRPELSRYWDGQE